jgi:DNA-binding transcriptional LysR family regulator
MELRHLRYFSTLSALGSFRAAAEQLGISQPTLSQQIRQLEDELSVRLVERNSRPVQTTEAGKVLLERGSRILHELRSIQLDMNRYAGIAEGRVVVGTTDTVASYYLPQVLAAFANRYPGIQLALEQPDADRLQAELLEQNFDVGLVVLASTNLRVEPGLEIQPLSESPLVAAVPPGHHLAGRQHVTLSDLRFEDLILSGEHSASRAVFERAMKRRGFTPKIRFEARNASMLMGLASANLGVTIASERIVKALRPRLKRLLIEDLDASCVLALMWRRDGLESTAVASFVEFARDWPWGHHAG